MSTEAIVDTFWILGRLNHTSVSPKFWVGISFTFDFRCISQSVLATVGPEALRKRRTFSRLGCIRWQGHIPDCGPVHAILVPRRQLTRAGFVPGRFGAYREQLKWFKGFVHERQGQNRALTVLYVPYSLDSGTARTSRECRIIQEWDCGMGTCAPLSPFVHTV